MDAYSIHVRPCDRFIKKQTPRPRRVDNGVFIGVSSLARVVGHDASHDSPTLVASSPIALTPPAGVLISDVYVANRTGILVDISNPSVVCFAGVPIATLQQRRTDGVALMLAFIRLR